MVGQVMKKLFFSGCLIAATLINAQTEIIAHRGYWKKEGSAQNSIAALKYAQEIGVYGSEFDVRLSKDGVPVINHDEDIQGYKISETEFSVLKKLRLNNGEKFPTLLSYLKQGKKEKGVKLIIELKPLESKTQETLFAKKAVDLVDKLKLEDQVEFISFSLFLCKEIKRFSPTAKVQYLNGDLSPQQIKEAGIDGIDYHYKIFLKNPTWISEAHQLNLITNSWTVDDPEIYKELRDQGIGFITTNKPLEFLKLKK